MMDEYKRQFAMIDASSIIQELFKGISGTLFSFLLIFNWCYKTTFVPWLKDDSKPMCLIDYLQHSSGS
ncbi:hypothetical protein QG37_04866 [Candidozyma auris]|uniref:Uncharacterized protein n=1 Tax=Candidozyma auris TaxID=498019 RepID=A0A0L0NVZ5_CANAR|nr:hypothetical protein QG37_04866 [[Candida] auris]